MIDDLQAPSPAVEHLPTIFRRISKGDIRIPAFQRRFVWNEAQVTSLFESVYRGFPIGSLLLWNVRSEILRDAAPDNPFPQTPKQYPTNYILDGMQRLSALYGAFNYQAGSSDSKFNVWFNLIDEHFYNEDSLDNSARSTSIPVKVLFSPREMIAEQKRLSLLDPSPRLLDRTIALQARFQEYMLPYVTIYRDDVSVVVQIFERVNTSGTMLSTVDFMRAVTWSNHFDLNKELEYLTSDLDNSDFVVSEETLIKLIGIELDREPLPHSLLTLRTETDAALNKAVKAVRKNLSRVVVFAQDRLRIFSSAYIPYEGQLLVLYKALKDGSQKALVPGVVRWFWAVGLNESLRGKPDHYVARAVRSIEDLVAGRVRGVEPRLGLQAVELIERRFIQTRALSAAVAGMFAQADARSLLTGDVVDHRRYMKDPSGSHFVSLLNLTELRNALQQPLVSSKLIANTFVADEAEIRQYQHGDALAALQAGDWKNLKSRLESQFVSKSAFEALVSGRYAEFLRKRAAAMLEYARQLVSSS
jgi:hypothetical protein